jgi:hypothetical protein
LLSLAAALGASDCRGQAAVPPRQGGAGDLVMIHGIMGYWPGCARFKQQVESYGYRAWDYPVASPALLAHTIANNRANGIMSGPLCLVGYSMGADQVIRVARHLDQYGVKVDRLVLFEADMPKRIPPNVQYCFNHYESRPLTDWLPMFRGLPVQADNPSTPVVNFDVKQTDPHLTGLTHFFMATNPRAQTMAISQALPPGTVRR